MKTVSFALLLMATLAFVVGGCSDNSAVPVSPTEQSAQVPASLDKSTNVPFTLFLSIPVDVPADITPYLKIAGNTVHMKDVPIVEKVTASDARVSGSMEHLLSLMLNLETGEGPCHGSFTLTPDPAIVGEGAVWVGTYEGYRSRTANPLVFTLPLKMVAHGRGGTIDGMQVFTDATLTVYTDAAHYPLPTGWLATGTGIIKQH